MAARKAWLTIRGYQSHKRLSHVPRRLNGTGKEMQPQIFVAKVNPVFRGLVASGWVAFVAILAWAVVMPAAQAAPEGGALKAYDYKMAGDRNHTRVVLRFDREPDPEWFLLRDPHRLVVDLSETDFDVESDDLESRGLISHVRYGRIEAGRSRMILTADAPFAVDGVEVIENETSSGYRMIVDITSASDADFEATLRDRLDRTDSDAGMLGDSERLEPVAQDRRFTIVVDAGHGGIDTGARGVNGTLEKTITLAFARELVEKLDDSGKYNVLLTRDEDIFLRLDERVRIARQHEADLFISIHADAIRYRGVRGATVYTVSDEASDAKAAATAARENLSDELAGIKVEDDKNQVADILADLARRETHTFSIRFARSLLGEISDSLDLVKNPHRYAGFQVLRAPDVPSVLLELGYLSNPQDEEQLRDSAWRAKAVESIGDAIDAFAAARTGG